MKLNDRLSEYEAMASTIQRLHVFEGMDAAQLEPHLQEAHLVRLPKGRVLFHEGESVRHFYFVASGCIQVMANQPGGEPRLVELFKTGEAVCDAATLLGGAYHVTAHACMDSRIIALPRRYMLEKLQAGGDLTGRMLQMLSKRILAMQQHTEELGMGSSLSRLACYLLHFAPLLASESYQLTLPTSKQALASRLNTSKESLSRGLRELRELGIIEVDGRTITVLDRTALIRVKQAPKRVVHKHGETVPA